MNVEWAKLLLTPFIYLLTASLAIYLIWLFRIRLGLLVRFLGIKGLKVAGVEISMSSEEIDKAQEKRLGAGIAEEDVEDRKDLAEFAAMVAPYVFGRRVLWVDDNPDGNTLERRAFRILGISVVNCLSTSDALEALCRDDFDLVLSDVVREFGVSGPCAELERVRAAADEADDGWKTLSRINEVWGFGVIPLIFYHGDQSKQTQRDRAARDAAAIGATTSPATLYRWVLSVLLYETVKENDKLRPLLLLVSPEIRRRK